MPEETINLGDLVRYMIRNWKWIVLLALVGALLGFCVSSPSTTTFSNTIQQSYLITTDYNSVDLITHKISSITKDDAVLEAICQEAGVEEMEAADVRPMIEISQSKTTVPSMPSADTQVGNLVTITVTNTDEDTCQAVAQAVEKQFLQLNETFTQEYAQFSIEKLSDSVNQTESTSSGRMKTIAVGAIALCVLGVLAFGVLYLMNGTVKTVDEIRNYFGLYPIGQITCNQKNAKGILNKNELPVNDYAYLLDSLKAMKLDNLLICGNTENEQIEAVKKWLKDQDDTLSVNPALAVEGQLRAMEADGVVLCAQLWKTTKNELLREIEICQKLNKSIAGVIILK